MDKLLTGRRVLVVEDEMMNLMMIEDMLADLAGASVSAAATVDQALALIKRQSFDAAMLDLNLNGMKSYTGRRHARRARRAVRLFHGLRQEQPSERLPCFSLAAEAVRALEVGRCADETVDTRNTDNA